MSLTHSDELICLEDRRHVFMRGGAVSAAFSPDGARIIAASEDGNVLIWDVASKIELVCLEGPASGNLHVGATFSPDGNLALATLGGTVRLWDVSRTAQTSHPAVGLAAALAHGIGRRTSAEAEDLLMQDAPKHLFQAIMKKLGPEHAAEVEKTAAQLRAALHPNIYLSPTQFAEKYS